MLLRKLLGDPDEYSGFEPRGVGEDLPEVVVVGLFELVLDDDLGVGGVVRGDYVGGVGIDRHF